MNNNGMKPMAKKGTWSQIGMIGVLAMGLAVPMQAEAEADFQFFWNSTEKKTNVMFGLSEKFDVKNFTINNVSKQTLDMYNAIDKGASRIMCKWG